MAYSNNVVEKLVNSTDNASEVFNQASNAIENTSNKIDVLKERSQEAESVTNQLTEAWKNLKHILDEYLVLDIAKEMVKTASATENLKLSLSTVTESQKATNEIFEQYEQIIINTPEKIEGLVNAHVKLSNSVKDITPNEIRDLGLAALAAGKGSEGIMQLANALANLYNAAKASEQSIMSLKNAGLNTVEIFKNVETFALTGKEAFNMVMAYVVSHSAENAEKIKNNWSTLTTEMSNMWEVFQNELMKAGLFDILKDGLKSVISEFKELSDDGTLKAWITDITGAIKLLVENWHILIGAVVLLKKEMIESAIVSLVSAKTSMAELGTETVMVEKNLVGLRSGITTVEVVTKEFSLATLATNAWGKAIESVGLKFGLLAFDIGYAIPKIIEAISILNDWRKTVKETAEHDAAWHKKHDVSVPKEGEDKILVKQTDDEINEKTKQQQEAVKKLSDLKKEMYQNEIREAEKVLHNYEKLKEAGVKAYQAIIDKQIESNKWSEDFNKSLDKLERQVNNEGLSKESVESNNQQYVKSLLSKTQEAVGNIKSQADIDNVKELEKETRSEISTISDKRIKIQIIAALREVEIKRQEEQIKLTEKQAEAQKKKNEELDKNINHIKINICDIQAKLKDLAEKPIEIRIKLQEVALKKINDELDALQKKKDQIEGKTSQEEPKSPEKKDIVKSQDDKSMEQEKSRIEEMIPVPLDDALKYGSFSKERRIDMRNQLIAQGYNVGNMGLDDNKVIEKQTKNISANTNQNIITEKVSIDDEDNKKLAADNAKLAESSEKVTIAADNETKEINDAADAMKRFGEEVRHIEVKNISSNSNDEKETHASGGLVTTPKGIAGQGEYVINRAATAGWGTNFLSSINDLSLKEFALSSIRKPSLPNLEKLSSGGGGFGGGQNVVNLKIGDETYPMMAHENTIKKLKQDFGAAQRQAQRYGRNISFAEYLKEN